MSDTAQKRKLGKYRTGPVKRGMARFEVLGRDTDRDLIRKLAKRLAEADPEAARLRQAIGQSIEVRSPSKGGILAALRRSPLVGANVNLIRSREAGRKAELQRATSSIPKSSGP